MVQAGRAFQQFESYVTTQSREEMVGLGGHGLGWQYLQGGILFQGFVIGLNVPSFVID